MYLLCIRHLHVDMAHNFIEPEANIIALNILKNIGAALEEGKPLLFFSFETPVLRKLMNNIPIIYTSCPGFDDS